MVITLPQSILSVMQMPEFGRQIIYGIIDHPHVLLYGKELQLR
jgi:ribose transport system permease protein